MFKWLLGLLALAMPLLTVNPSPAIDHPPAPFTQPQTTAPTRYDAIHFTPLEQPILDALYSVFPEWQPVDDRPTSQPDVLTASLSPDGQRLVLWIERVLREERRVGAWLCVLDLTTSTTACTEQAERWSMLSSAFLAWSPDGRYVAYHTDWALSFDDSDIYLVDTTTASVTNLTGRPDEGQSVIEALEGETSLLLDYAPFWSADGQDLYFFRTLPAEADDNHSLGKLTLQRLTLSDGTLSEVMAVPDAIPAQRLSSTAQVSLAPDGTRVALLLNWWLDEQSMDLWVLDLVSQQAEQWVSQAEFASLLPPWATDEVLLNSNDVAWVADGSLLVAFESLLMPLVLDSPLYALVDGSTHALTPLTDLSSYADMETFMREGQLVKHVLVAPDGSSLVLLVGPNQWVDDTHDIAVYHLPLAPQQTATLIDVVNLPTQWVRFLAGRGPAATIGSITAQHTALLSPPLERLDALALVTLTPAEE